MPAIIEPPPNEGEPQPPLWRRAAWFAGLAVVGALSAALIAYALNLLLQ